MSYRVILTTVSAFLCMTFTHAQESRENVELLAYDGSNAIFCSEGYGIDKKEALENSRIATLRKILFEGVQDFNDGYPIVKSGRDTNIWLLGLFDKEKNATYKTFLGDIELIGDFDNTAAGEVHCVTNVVIKHKMLLQYAESNGVTKENSVQPTPAPQPKKEPKKRTYL